MNCAERRVIRSDKKNELLSHQENNTYDVIKRETGMNVIKSKWVFAEKTDADGKIVRYKARLVAKGFNQEYGIDCNETYSPVMKVRAMRLMFALSTMFIDVELEQLDFKTAFVNASVEEKIYVQPAEGMGISTDCVLKLNKALYGIKQAPSAWNRNINEYLI